MRKIIDFRSDTCTLQPEEMLKAMVNAKVGDEYYDDDPTINELLDLSCEIMDKEAALFTASGTMNNLIAILTQTKRGNIIIAEDESHVPWCEGSNIAAFGGVIPKLIKGRLGIMDVTDIEAAILSRPKGYDAAEYKLLVVENAHTWGTCTTPEQMAAYRKVADKHGLNIHVDGARIFNAAVALDVKPSKLAKDADTLGFCLSKGLSCPFGGVLVGSKEIISRARHYKQILGAGFRQAGYMAACGVYALNNMVDRLAEDHENAKLLAKGLVELGMEIDMNSVQINMVFFSSPPSLIDLHEFYKKMTMIEGIKMIPPEENHGKIRLATHWGIEKEDIEYFLKKAKEVVNS